jgi:hypothetical protein
LSALALRPNSTGLGQGLKLPREGLTGTFGAAPRASDATGEVALTQDLHVQVGTPFLERIHANLEERARAIIERRPDLEHLFDD